MYKAIIAGTMVNVHADGTRYTCMHREAAKEHSSILAMENLQQRSVQLALPKY